MKIIHSTRFLVIALSVLATPVVAETMANDASTLQSLNSGSPCRTLMTELECSLHKTTLAQLNPGPARDRYLADYALLMQERESSCSCNRKVTEVTLYPHRRQALLRF